MKRPTVAVADLHGHLAHFRTLLSQLDASLSDYTLVTLGDYVDNGPDIPGLLDFLIQLKADRGDRFQPIMGNHDLALLRTLGWPGDPFSDWWREWQHYWGWRGGWGSTPQAYGASTLAGFRKAFPPAHREFLAGLPWCLDDGEHFFVHAGLEPGPLEPQREALVMKELPRHRRMPAQLREKGLSVVADTSWGRVVVSGHTKRPLSYLDRAPIQDHPNFLAPTRICLSGEVDMTGRLWAVVLPERAEGSQAEPFVVR